jgi:hypothetical protein
MEVHNRMISKRKKRERCGILFANRAAVVDRAVVSVWGKLDGYYEEGLRESRNVGILKPKSIFSRCIFGKSPLTGNPIRVEYGKTKNFANVPDARVTFTTEKRAVTAAELRMEIDRLQVKDSRNQLSEVELSFDVTGFGVLQFRRQLIYGARFTRMLRDRGGRRTLYIGGPKSAWQLRIYDKAESVVRFEFVFRRGFLSKYGINAPEQLLSLRKFNLWKLASVRQFSRCRLAKFAKSWTDHDQKIVRSWNKRRQGLQRLAKILRSRRIDPALVLRRARIQKKLESMLRRMIW